MIFESVDAISNAKNLEDQYKNDIRILKKKADVLKMEKTEQDAIIAAETKKKDQFKDELKLLVDYKEKTDRQNAFYVTQSRENINNLNQQIK